MEDTRFDDMTKVFGSQKSRRLTLGALLGGALGALGLVETEAGKSGKCKPKPGECETCKKGKCQRKNGKKTCKKGKIKPKANGTACSVGTCQSGTCVGGGGQGNCPVCQQLQGGVCVNAPAGTTCNGTGKCNGSGTCNPAPACTPKGGFCLKLQGTECCSDTCTGGTVTTGTCAQSQVGQQCITNDDCTSGFPILAFCGPNFTCQPIVIGP